ncbi:MAG: hypothetical protein IJ480_03915 [Clostridia bacterium]|nr:hypothetical protein [Clostridia bacterium]
MPEKILFHATYEEESPQINPEQLKKNFEKLVQRAKTTTVHYIPIPEKSAKVSAFTETAKQISQECRYDLTIHQDNTSVYAVFHLGKENWSFITDLTFFRALFPKSEETFIGPDEDPYIYYVTFVLYTHSTQICE